MKNILSASVLAKALRVSGFAMVSLGLAIAYSVSTSSHLIAQGPPQFCTVCHKGRQNLDLPCNSQAFRRHQDHGDTPGPCPTSPIAHQSEAAPVTVSAMSARMAPAEAVAPVAPVATARGR
jgi:hypothetical protein